MRAAGALEADPAVRNPDEMAAGFLAGFNVSTLAKYRLTRAPILRAVSRITPGAYTYEIVRTKFIDEILLAEAAAGLEELVLLGAGFDSRPYRLADALQGVRVFEVDHPQSQASKRAHLRRILGEEPQDVDFVAIDFNRDELEATLAQAGHERSAHTLFVWSGVSMYLPEAAVAGVLGWIGEHENPRTSVVFDACWAGAIDGSREYHGAAELRARVAKMDEPLRWGMPEGEVEETLARFGLRAEKVLGEDEGRSTYLRRSDGTLHDRPYGFGALIHARTARGDNERDGGTDAEHR